MDKYLAAVRNGSVSRLDAMRQLQDEFDSIAPSLARIKNVAEILEMESLHQHISGCDRYFRAARGDHRKRLVCMNIDARAKVE